MNFKPGDKVVAIKGPLKHEELRILEGGLLLIVRTGEKLTYTQKWYVLESIYNSPLMEALREE